MLNRLNTGSSAGEDSLIDRPRDPDVSARTGPESGMAVVAALARIGGSRSTQSVLATARSNPERHAFDGGRSSAIRRELQPLLEELLRLLDADIGIVLHMSSHGHAGVLATASVDGIVPPLVSEEVRLTHGDGRPLSITKPQKLEDIVVSSTGRPWSACLASSLAVPWAESGGSGLVLLGVRAGRWVEPSLALAAKYRLSLAVAHRDAARRGSMQLAVDLATACIAVDRAEIEATQSAELLAHVATIARGLFGTAVAYIATSERGSGNFPFATLVGIRTSSFRRLRMRHDQGLGGCARRERRTVRTLDYSRDCRLMDAPVKETEDEGIVSAMCTPLMIDGSIQGSLYVGDRRLRAFSETDAAMFEEFAGHATMVLDRQRLEECRLSVLRHQERERLASMLHDSVVRSLVEIGYSAYQGRDITEDAAVHGLLRSIGDVAGSTLEALRGELATLSNPRERDRPPRAGELLEALRLEPRRGDVTRTVELYGLDNDSEVPEHLFDALISVGEEALANAERHSECTSEHVRLERTDAELRLHVSDNGRGTDLSVLESVLAKRSGHLGLRSMRAATRAVGGYTKLVDGPFERGTEVFAVVPCPKKTSAS